ncbi:zinc finger BED domain-containing protein 4-like [Topomyia yanbarensis]|uniref:zinc finger BED domain-containing protein 4-like n=1 Tax=Topomyia yanbarensis TaxID=2498891 RepID=UPI00273C514C|nr:zinc finger BED domain-containing protein 4-like [Topomyia yanbarensis]
MVLKDNLCLSTPEKVGFKYFCKTTVPLWTPPSRRTLTRQMEQNYERLSQHVREKFSKLSAVVLTMDGWTEPHNTKAFLGVTVHYAVDDEMHSAVLGVEPMSSAHTHDNLATASLQFCNHWGLKPTQVSHVVTDNAPNIVLAAKEAFGESKHLACFNHTLNLIPSSGVGFKSVNGQRIPYVPGIPALIKKLKNIVTFSHTSYKFADELRKVQLDGGATEGTLLRLIQDVTTRWNSTYLMCDRFLKMQKIVSVAALNFPDLDMLTAAELATLASIQDLLWPFYDATVEMSAEKTTTASKVIPLISMINIELSKVEIPDRDICAQSLKKFLTGEMVRRFGEAEYNMLLTMATLLDPRFLKVHFQKALAVSKGISLMEKVIVNELRKEAPESNAAHVSSTAIVTRESNSKRNLWNFHDTLVNQVATAYSTDDYVNVARQEIKAFYSRTVMPRKTNPLAVCNNELRSRATIGAMRMVVRVMNGSILS